MMTKLVSDDIPNIRFNVAKSYRILIGTLKRLPSEGPYFPWRSPVKHFPLLQEVKIS